MNEILTGLTVFKLSPRDYAWQCCIPAAAGNYVWGFLKAKTHRCLKAANDLADKNGGKLTRVLAVNSSIVAAHTVPRMIRQQSLKLSQLTSQYFLHAHQVRSVKIYHAGNHGLAIRPSLVTIVRIVIADIKTHHLNAGGYV